MAPEKRPSLVQPGLPSEAAAPVQDSPERAFAREALSVLRQEMTATPAPAGQGPTQRYPASLLLVIALAGAFLVQRTEGTRDMVAQAQTTQADILTKFDARLAAQEAEIHRAAQRATKSEETLREAFWILAEDSRANWDALTSIHEATKPPGAPVLRPPTTSARLSGLREALARE